jgi:hypothetical protein
MRAQLISISAVSRDAHREWSAELIQQGFDMALAVVHNLNASSVAESKVAIENWTASERLTPAMRVSLYQFYGWEQSK